MRQESSRRVSWSTPTSSLYLLYYLLLFLSILFSQYSVAQPKAIGPDDLSRLRQQTEFSGDWSETDAFDLDRYITLRVTIEGFNLPEDAGNAVMWFTTRNPKLLARYSDLPSDFLFKGMLQSADVVRYLKLSERDFPRGAEAILRGWPATDRSFTGSALLIDDVQIIASGKTIALHGDNPKMVSKRQNTETAE